MSQDSSQRIDTTPVSFYGLALRLRRGASPITSWSADRGTMSETLTIGSGDNVSWSIRGPGVAPLELYVRLREGRVEAKSALPGRGAKLDGAPLGDQWVSLEPGSRVEFGFACLALEFDAAPLTGVVEPPSAEPISFLGNALESGPIKKPTMGPVIDVNVDATPVLEPRSERRKKMPAAQPQVIELKPAPAPERPKASAPAARPSAAPEPAKARASAAPRSEPAKDRNKAVMGVVPARTGKSRKAAIVRFALLALLTLCAYGGWIFLLEHF